MVPNTTAIKSSMKTVQKIVKEQTKFKTDRPDSNGATT